MAVKQPDVVIVGAGPSGMAAALVLHKAGASVRVVDENPAPGGQIYRGIERNQQQRPELIGLLGDDYAAGSELANAFKAARSTENLTLSAQTAVWDIEAEDQEAGKPLRIGLVSDGQTEMLYPRHILLACGAIERPTPFPGWTLPGVMTVGAAQTLMKDAGLLPQGRVVVAGNGPLLALFVKQLLAAGVKPAKILHTAQTPVRSALSALPQAVGAAMAAPGVLWKGWSWLQEIRRSGVPQQYGVEDLTAEGEGQLAEVSYTVNGKTSRLEADLLLVHDGVIPNSHLAMAADLKHEWHEQQRCWQPQQENGADSTSSNSGISVTGDAAGIQGADIALIAGRLQGWRLAQVLGLKTAADAGREIVGDERRLNKLRQLRQFLDVLYPPSLCFYQELADNTLVCRCEEVTAGELREVAALGCMGPNQGKAFTRCGMGPCMGRLCGNTVSQLLAEAHNTPVAEMGHYRIRPPVRPLSVGELANLELDRGPALP